MELPKLRIAFNMRQKLALLEQETKDTPQITDSCAQAGLILLTAETRGGIWRRTIEEFILGPQQLRTVSGQLSVERDELRKLSMASVAGRPIKLNVDEPLVIESDRLNKKPVIPVVADMVPYVLSNEPAPIPAFALYFPTITPAMPEERRQVGSSWKGTLSVACGAGVFTVSYGVTLREYLSDDPVVQIVIDSQPSSSRAGKIMLHMLPQGSWMACISHKDSACRWAKGQWGASIRAMYKTSDENVDVEVRRWQNDFALERTLLPFNEQEILPAVWKSDLNPETVGIR